MALLSRCCIFHKLHVAAYSTRFIGGTRNAAMQCKVVPSAPHDGNSGEQGARTPGDTNVAPRVGRGTVAMPRSSLFGCSELCMESTEREEVVGEQVGDGDV